MCENGVIIRIRLRKWRAVSMLTLHFFATQIHSKELDISMVKAEANVCAKACHDVEHGKPELIRDSRTIG